MPTVPRRRGRKPRVALTQLLPALIFHFMNGAGTLAQHFFQLFDAPLADSSWADRRARLPWEVFAELMRRALRPMARRRRHPVGFWRTWRLVALDGTQFSLTNTPQIKATVKKAKSRRGRAAFAKLTTGVLLEIGLHNPLAAAIGRKGQSEWELARGLLAQLPKGALLLADRLHGCAAFAVEALAACQRVGSHFLFRARSNVKGQVINSRGVSAWGYGGQTMERGDWRGNTPSSEPRDQSQAWKKQTVLAEHELPGTARHDPLAYLQNRSVDWLDHQLAARELLAIDPAKTFLVVEHEYPPARIQDKAALAPILAGSLAYTRSIDQAAAAMYALQHEVLAAQGIAIQGVGREAYRS